MTDLDFLRIPEGLVIIEASYFPVEDAGLPMPELGIDVTISMQALVRKGQLYIPGGTSKVRRPVFSHAIPISLIIHFLTCAR